MLSVLGPHLEYRTLELQDSQVQGSVLPLLLAWNASCTSGRLK